MNLASIFFYMFPLYKFFVHCDAEQVQHKQLSLSEWDRVMVSFFPKISSPFNLQGHTQKKKKPNCFISVLWCDQSGRKETVLDLAKFVDKGVQVKLTGGRQGRPSHFPAFRFLHVKRCVLDAVSVLEISNFFCFITSDEFVKCRFL